MILKKVGIKWVVLVSLDYMLIRTSFIFSDILRWVAITGWVASIILIFTSEIYLVMVVTPLAFVIYFLETGYKFNMERKEYRKYTGFFGYGIGRWTSYLSLGKLSTGSRRMSQRLNSRGSSTIIRFTEYYLSVLIDSEPIELFNSRDEKKVANKAMEFNKYFSN